MGYVVALSLKIQTFFKHRFIPKQDWKIIFNVPYANVAINYVVALSL